MDHLTQEQASPRSLTQADKTCLHVNTSTTLKQIKEIPAETSSLVINNLPRDTISKKIKYHFLKHIPGTVQHICVDLSPISLSGIDIDELIENLPPGIPVDYKTEKRATYNFVHTTLGKRKRDDDFCINSHTLFGEIQSLSRDITTVTIAAIPVNNIFPCYNYLEAIPVHVETIRVNSLLRNDQKLLDILEKRLHQETHTTQNNSISQTTASPAPYELIKPTDAVEQQSPLSRNSLQQTSSIPSVTQNDDVPTIPPRPR